MEWTRILGALLVIACTTGFGWIKANEYGIRFRNLAQLRSALAMLESEIVFGATPLGEACLLIARQVAAPINTVFLAVAEGLKGREGTARVWERAWHQAPMLHGEDQAIISRLGSVLGASDRSDQVKHLRLTQERLAQQEQGALEDRQKHERMWRYLGSLSGLAIVLTFW